MGPVRSRVTLARGMVCHGTPPGGRVRPTHELERVVNNTLTSPGNRQAGIFVAVASFLSIGVVAPGCSEADPKDFGPPPESASPDPTAEMGSAPPGTPLYAEVFSVTDAAVLDGDWFVLDGRANQVHRISPEGEPVRSFGREGSGPGEFRRANAIVAHGDSIVVVGGGMVHVFGSGGEHIADRRVQPAPSFDCFAPTMRTTGAVSVETGLLLQVECFGLDGSLAVHIVAEGADGFVRSLAHREGKRGQFDFGGTLTVVAGHPRGFLFGSAWESCLDLYSLSGRRLDAICHDWLEPVDLPPEVAREFEGMIADARRQGIRVRLPETLPAIVGVSAMAGGRLVYRRLVSADLDMDTFQLVTRDETGQAVVLPVPPAPVLFQDGRSVLAAWEELEGTRIYTRTLNSLDGS